MILILWLKCLNLFTRVKSKIEIVIVIWGTLPNIWSILLRLYVDTIKVLLRLKELNRTRLDVIEIESVSVIVIVFGEKGWLMGCEMYVWMGKLSRVDSYLRMWDGETESGG